MISGILCMYLNISRYCINISFFAKVSPFYAFFLFNILGYFLSHFVVLFLQLLSFCAVILIVMHLLPPNSDPSSVPL